MEIVIAEPVPCETCGKVEPEAWPKGVTWAGHWQKCPDCGHVELFISSMTYHPETGKSEQRGTPEWVRKLFGDLLRNAKFRIGEKVKATRNRLGCSETDGTVESMTVNVDGQLVYIVGKDHSERHHVSFGCFEADLLPGG